MQLTSSFLILIYIAAKCAISEITISAAGNIWGVVSSVICPIIQAQFQRIRSRSQPHMGTMALIGLSGPANSITTRYHQMPPATPKHISVFISNLTQHQWFKMRNEHRYVHPLYLVPSCNLEFPMLLVYFALLVKHKNMKITQEILGFTQTCPYPTYLAVSS